MWRMNSVRRKKCLPEQEYDLEGLTRKQRIRARIRHKRPAPWYAAASACLLLSVLTGGVSMVPSLAEGNTESPVTTEDDSLSLYFVGDMMLGRGTGQVGETFGYDTLFSGVSSLWEDADLVFANLESAILSGSAEDYDEQDKNILLSAGYDALEAAMDAGVNAFACANNHMYDYGEDAVSELVEYFTETDTLYSGIGKDIDGAASYQVAEAGGTSIAFLSISDVSEAEAAAGEGKAGVLSADSYTDYNMLVYQASREADLTIVYVHWGTENSTSSTEEQQAIAHRLADAGADIIIGTHPHVVQDVEAYGDSIIFYSLGNFIFDQGNTYARDSVVVKYTLDEDGNGAFTLYPVRITDGVPSLTDNVFYRARIFRELTQGLDSGSYHTDDDGNIVIPFTAQ